MIEILLINYIVKFNDLIEIYIIKSSLRIFKQNYFLKNSSWKFIFAIIFK
jgi:hypothetical protein